MRQNKNRLYLSHAVLLAQQYRQKLLGFDIRVSRYKMTWEMKKSYFRQSAVPLVVSQKLRLRILRGNEIWSLYLAVQRSKKYTKETLTWATATLGTFALMYPSILLTHFCFEYVSICYSFRGKQILLGGPTSYHFSLSTVSGNTQHLCMIMRLNLFANLYTLAVA